MVTSRLQKIQEHIEGMMMMQNVIGTHKDRFLRQFGLNRAQMGMLYLIAGEKKLTVKEIALKKGITSSAATQIIEGLVKNGYLQRITSPQDRRVVYAQFSPLGKKKFEAFRKAHIEKIANIFETLTDAELDLLISIPKKILEKL